MARVLIVDDAKFMRNLVKDALTASGHEIVGEAEEGNEALEKYKVLKPDVVTMDITMRGKDGISAVEEIMGFDKEARIVMVTALGQEKILSRVIKMGAKGFVVKPFKPEKIQEAIDAALR